MNIQEQFNLIANEYDANRRNFIACFDDYYGTCTDFVASTLKSKPATIVDLGSGTGLLPSFWYTYFPNANYILTDIAKDMLNVAKKRFAGLENVSYEICDYREKLPDCKADLIISGLSIHHLEHPEKEKLFKRIYDALPEKGVFVNYDQFCVESAEINQKIAEYWFTKISNSLSDTENQRWQERQKLDRECTIAQEILWLKNAGFKSVECIYSHSKFGVILAEK